MPPRIVHQDRELLELFRRRIKAKIAKEKLDLNARVDEEFLPWVSWALKPVAGAVSDLWSVRDGVKGAIGEGAASLGFWLALPSDWILMNNVVLEPQLGEFIQLDHVLIGPPGVYLIETKAWDGAFLAVRDNWKREEGKRWVPCGSPTRQNQRHERLFRHWLRLNQISGSLGLPASDQLVFPVVLFTRASWLKVDQCCMPVYEKGLLLAFHIRRQTSRRVLSSGQVDSLAQALVNARPCGAEALPTPPPSAAAIGPA